MANTNTKAEQANLNEFIGTLNRPKAKEIEPAEQANLSQFIDQLHENRPSREREPEGPPPFAA